jgi:hypothetical protein
VLRRATAHFMLDRAHVSASLTDLTTYRERATWIPELPQGNPTILHPQREARLLRVKRNDREASVECWIGVVTEGNRRIVRLAGRLSAAQVPELFNAWAGQGNIELDLTDLLSADPAGIEALQRIRRSGATLSGTPGYIQLQLHTADPTASR